MAIPAQVLARAVVSPALNLVVSGMPPTAATVTREVDGRTYLDLFLEGSLSEADLAALGVHINSRLPNGTMTAEVPLDALQAVAALAGMTRISASYRAHPCLDLSVPLTEATPNYWSSSPPGFIGLAGAGVIIGDVNNGIDYTHDDFKNADGTTRLLYIWDQTDATTPHPSGFTYGREFAAADINASLPTVRDGVDGHGTHCMGIAAGDGSATGNGRPADVYIGMAPRADMIAVVTDYSTAHVVDGVNYIFQRAAAAGKNAVVNLSLGSGFGAHDGTEVFDTSLDALVGAGKIVVVSAGNDGGQALHALQLVPPGGNQAVSFSIPFYLPNSGTQNDFLQIDAYYPAAADMQVAITSPRGTSDVAAVVKGGTGSSTGTDGYVYLENGYTASPGGDNNIFIQIYDGTSAAVPRVGTWTITLTPVSGANPQLDLWFASFHLGATGVQPRFTTDVDEHVTVNSPGSAAEVITVGAVTNKNRWHSIDGNTYVFSDSTVVGALTRRSSVGPLRNGAQKPDIVSLGGGVISALSSAVPRNSNTNPYIDSDGQHWIMTGTSASSPHVAGGVALILSDTPNLTPAQVKARLSSEAIVDAQTGAVWNYQYGNGKLRTLLNDTTDPTVAVASPNGGETFAMGSVHDITWTASDNVAVTAIDIDYSLDNGGNWTPVATGEADDGAYPWIVPSAPTALALIRVVARDRADNSGSDTSDEVFTIADQTAPSVTVTSPDGGENWATGSLHNITWMATDNIEVTAIDVDYSTNNGTTWTPVATNEPNDSTYAWTVPSTPSTRALVRVAARDAANNSGSDASDRFFTLAMETSNVVSAGQASDCISTAHPCVTVPIIIDRTNATPLRSFSVQVGLSAELVLCSGTSSITEGTYLSSIGATSFQVTSNGGGVYTVDGAILGDPCGAVAATGTLFTVAVTNAGGNGTGTVSVTGQTFGDCDSIAVAGTAGTGASVAIDNTPPLAVINLFASQNNSGNGGDGTAMIRVAFGAPGDASTIEVYRAGFGNYPEYDDGPGAGSVPAVPAYPPAAPWVLTGLTASGQSDDVGTRDVWYYVVFTKDACGNVSAVSNRTGGTPSYFLGDSHDGFAACAGDNSVGTSDLSFIGAHYGITLSDSDTLACLDVGPTTNYLPDSRPTTDNLLGFEDLVILSLGYGEFSKGAARPAPAQKDELVVEAPARVEPGQAVTARLLAHGAGSVYALSAALEWDAAVVEPLATAGGELLTRNGGCALSPGPGRVDVALLGLGDRGLSGAGVLATITFRALRSGEPLIRLSSLEARDASNKPIHVEGGTQESGQSTIPRIVELLPAAPNPFNPRTTLTYRLPLRAAVGLRIFSAEGRLVRTLVSGTAGAGEHRVVWDGRDDQGTQVSSGIYFMRLRSEGVTHARSLTLLK